MNEHRGMGRGEGMEERGNWIQRTGKGMRESNQEEERGVRKR